MDKIRHDLLVDGVVKNKTCNGKCSGCGDCCTEFLTITKHEYRAISNYLKEHPEIKCQYHSSLSTNIYCFCPFNDAQTHKCLIYEVRPKICRDFVCNLPLDVMNKNRDHNCTERGYYNLLNKADGSIQNNISFHALFFKDYEYDLRFRDGMFRQVSHCALPLVIQKKLFPMLVDSMDLEK